MADKGPPEQYSDEDTRRRLDLALRRSLTMPSKAAKKGKDSSSNGLRQKRAKPTAPAK
jgi:hypothetical protein